MLTNFTSMITSIRKETERLRDNLINNTTTPTNTNLSSLFQNTLLLAGVNKGGGGGGGHTGVNTALLRKRLESGFEFDLDLTVDTRKITGKRPNIRENYHYNEDQLRFENPIKKKLPQFVPNQSTVTAKSSNYNANANSRKNVNERFQNFQIKTLNNLQDQNSDLSLAEELFMAELQEKNKNENNPLLHNRRTPVDHRDEIRRRLATGETFDGRKSNRNLSSRLTSGGSGGATNLQVCFMNETASDDEADPDHTHQPQSLPCFDLSNNKGGNLTKKRNNVPQSQGRMNNFAQFLPTNIASSYQRFKPPPPRPPFWGEEEYQEDEEPQDFFGQQAKLQGEARQALAQAKEIAKLQLSQERIIRPRSPVAEMVANSLAKCGGGGENTTIRNSSTTLPLSALPSRLTPQFLTGLNLNLAQIEVIVNDFHANIEKLNESLVELLVERDDLNMEQDSMLVDVEDLTRYLAAKHNSEHQSLPLLSASQSILGKKK